jgi:hypothetical protein
MLENFAISMAQMAASIPQDAPNLVPQNAGAGSGTGGSGDGSGVGSGFGGSGSGSGMGLGRTSGPPAVGTGSTDMNPPPIEATHLYSTVQLRWERPVVQNNKRG